MAKLQFELTGEYPNQTLVKYLGEIDDVVEAVTATQEHSVVVPQGVTAVGDKAFFLSDATRVVLPDGVKTVGKFAFACSLTLSVVDLPCTVTDIAENAFSSTALSSVTLPQGLKTIGDSAFSSTDIDTLIIPPSVTVIGENAFAKCKKLRKIYIPSTVQTVGLNAFADCPQLTIYLSGSKPDCWQDEFKTEYVEEYNDGYAFDFHRGGVSGGWMETVAKTVAASFNPDKCPVKTNVTLNEFIKLCQSR